MKRCAHHSLAALYDDELLLWGGPGEHDLCVVPQDVIHLVLGQLLQVCAVDHTRLRIPAHRNNRQVMRMMSHNNVIHVYVQRT